MTLQSIGERPILERAAVKVSAKREDQADVGPAHGGGLDEACQQHIDEAATDRLVFDQSECFVKLIGDQQDAAALVAGAALGEHVTQGQLAGLEQGGQTILVREPLDVVLADHIERDQRSGESQKWVALQLGTDAEVAKTPVAGGIEARRQAREHDRRLAAASGTDQCRQALLADRLCQPCDRRVAAEKKIRVSRPEIGQPGVWARRNRFAGCVRDSRPVDREILDADGAAADDALDLAAGDGCLDGGVGHREYGPARRLAFGRSTEGHRVDLYILGPRHPLHDDAAHVELDPGHRLPADAVRLQLLDQLTRCLRRFGIIGRPDGSDLLFEDGRLRLGARVFLERRDGFAESGCLTPLPADYRLQAIMGVLDAGLDYLGSYLA